MFEAIIMAVLAITVVGLGVVIMMMDTRIRDMKGFIHRVERENQDLILRNRSLLMQIERVRKHD